MMHSVAKVLIIEDDDVIAQGMARHLTAAGFDAVGVANGETGLARLRYEQPDVCVLDLMLPGIDGWRVIEQARSEGIGTPIVVVSARGTEHDRINALELGADDYLVKPFSMKELAARVAAAARRGTRAQEPRRGDEIKVEELRLDPRNVQAYVDGASAELTPTEFRLLYALALDQGRVLTRDELLQRVWGRRASHRDRTVDVFVRKLREKIDAARRGTPSSRRATASATSSTPRRSSCSAAGVEEHERAARDPIGRGRALRDDESSVTAGTLIVCTSKPTCSSAARPVGLGLLGRVGHRHVHGRVRAGGDVQREGFTPLELRFPAAATGRSPGRCGSLEGTYLTAARRPASASCSAAPTSSAPSTSGTVAADPGPVVAAWVVAPPASSSSDPQPAATSARPSMTASSASDHGPSVGRRRALPVCSGNAIDRNSTSRARRGSRASRPGCSRRRAGVWDPITLEFLSSPPLRSRASTSKPAWSSACRASSSRRPVTFGTAASAAGIGAGRDVELDGVAALDLGARRLRLRDHLALRLVRGHVLDARLEALGRERASPRRRAPCRRRPAPSPARAAPSSFGRVVVPAAASSRPAGSSSSLRPSPRSAALSPVVASLPGAGFCATTVPAGSLEGTETNWPRDRRPRASPSPPTRSCRPRRARSPACRPSRRRARPCRPRPALLRRPASARRRFRPSCPRTPPPHRTRSPPRSRR